ncbi:hypothetical protein [Actinomarinicola tropica]|uniref:hypothetical protein n=1 Tax=Actinomarinicola tropica TaxID=2789776 RepID=UPI001E2CE4C7|nr:hypothetical protein [Actinomarinicola tropica]
MRRVARLPLVLTTVVVLVATLAGCTDDGPEGAAEDPTQRLVEIYAAAIESVVDEARARPDDDADAITLFLEVRDDVEVSAEVQVGVVGALEPWASVRFIDSLEEAVAVDDDEAPVRNDGMLIGLGAVGEGATSTTVMIDRYEGPEATTVFEIDVQRRAGEWTVDGTPRTVAVDAP